MNVFIDTLVTSGRTLAKKALGCTQLYSFSLSFFFICTQLYTIAGVSTF